MTWLKGGDDNPTNPIKWPRTTKWINITIIIPYGFLFPITFTALAIYAKEIADDSLFTNIKLPVFPMILCILVVKVGHLILTHCLELYSKIVFCLSSSVGFVTSDIRCKFALTVFYPQLYIFLDSITGICPSKSQFWECVWLVQKAAHSKKTQSRT